MQNTLTPPRTVGRPREFDIDTALDKAVQVFSERGYHSTSTNDLVQAMNLSVGSIYKAFKDKRAIFIAALDRQIAARNAELQIAFAAKHTGWDKLETMLLFYALLSCDEMGKQGCLVVNTANELAAFDPEIADRVLQSLQHREALLMTLILQGQADHSLPQTLNVKATARLLLCLLQGLRVVGKTAPRREDMLAAVAVAMKTLV